MMGKFNYKNWATLLAILVLFFSFGLAVRADAPAPTKISPEGTNVSAVVALQWNSVDGADKGYHYAVYLLSTQEVAAEDTITGTGATLTLSAGTSYYWNVESCWGSGFANWGRTCSGWTEPSFTFTTQGVAPATPPASTPPPPTKISPYDGANDAQIISSMNVGMSGVHFNWESVNGADKGYHYIVSGGGNNFEDTIDKTELILNLAYGTNYQWNVESCWGSGLFGWGRTCGGWGPLFTFTTMLNPNVNAPSNPPPGGINIICGMDFTDAKGETESAGNWCSDECAKGSIHQTYHFLKDGKHYSFRCYCSAPSGYYFGSTNCDSATAIVENCSVGQNWTCTKGGGCSGGYCTTLTGCTCSDWTVGQCNAGGCTGQRQYTRNCNPTGCDKESDCRSGASDVECKMPGFKKEGEFCNDASVF